MNIDTVKHDGDANSLIRHIWSVLLSLTLWRHYSRLCPFNIIDSLHRMLIKSRMQYAKLASPSDPDTSIHTCSFSNIQWPVQSILLCIVYHLQNILYSLYIVSSCPLSCTTWLGWTTWHSGHNGTSGSK